MKIKTFSGFACSEKFFARVIGRTSSGVRYLRLLGVVKNCAAGILILQSLQGFFLSYIPPHLRRAEINAAIKRMNEIAFPVKLDFLNSARACIARLKAAKIKFSFLRFFNKIDNNAAPPSLVKAAELEFLRIKTEFLQAQSAVKAAIIAAHIRPLQVENLLIYRYCDCEKFSAIPEICGYSLPYVYKLHQRGRDLFYSRAAV